MSRLALFLALALATPAFAVTPVTLKADIAESDGRVTLGELFDGAGSAADTPVAVRVGPTVVLDAGAVQVAARRSGLDWPNAQGLRRIVVRAGSAAPTSAKTRVEVLTYTRSLMAGEMVQPQDLAWTKAVGAPADAPTNAELVIGMAARRPLREGATVSMRDVSAPQVIKAGDTVAVTWSDGAITLTIQAKAMGNAAAGETFSLQNTASKKVIEALATGPGQAVSGPQAQRLKAARSSQYALR